MNKNLLEKVFKTSEGNILILAILTSLSLLIYIIVYYTIDSQYANKVTGVVFTNLFVGRVPALSLGYAYNLSHQSVIGFNVIIEMILVMFFYSLFVFSYKGILKVKALEEFFLKVEEKKELHKDKFDKYGRLGLFVFVFIPFWMTGPIVGSIIGYLIGMRHFVIMGIVFLATIISVSLWGVFLQEIIDFVVKFDARLIWVMIVTLIIVIIVLKFKKRD